MSVDLAVLPSLAFESRRKLPRESAVYFVVDAAGSVLYVGRSVDIRQRWATHHLLPQLKGREGIRIAWLLPGQSVSLHTVESALIRDLCPPLNVVGIAPPPDQAAPR